MDVGRTHYPLVPPGFRARVQHEAQMIPTGLIVLFFIGMVALAFYWLTGWGIE